MTITISPQTETLLKEQAERLGQDLDAYADLLLQSVLEDDTRDFEESCAAIAKALAGDPAEDISYEEYRAQFEAEREIRRRNRDATRDKVAA